MKQKDSEAGGGIFMKLLCGICNFSSLSGLLIVCLDAIIAVRGSF